jgi:hypothetical protein
MPSYTAVEQCPLWGEFFKTVIKLKEIYANTADATTTDNIRELIELFNFQNPFVYEKFPEEKHYFLSHYLINFAGACNQDLLDFLLFMYENKAQLDGITIIQYQLVRVILQYDAPVSFMRYLFTTQDFTIEEGPLFIRHDSARSEIESDFDYRFKHYYKKNDPFELHKVNSLKTYKKNLFARNCFYYFPHTRKMIYINQMGYVKNYADKITLINEEQYPQFKICGANGFILSSSELPMIASYFSRKFNHDNNAGSPFAILEQKIGDCILGQPIPELYTDFITKCYERSACNDSPIKLAIRSNCSISFINWIFHHYQEDLDACNTRGERAIDIAIQKNDLKSISWLVKHDASITSTSPNDHKYNACQLAVVLKKTTSLSTLVISAKEKKPIFKLVQSLLAWGMSKDILAIQEMLVLLQYIDPSKEDKVWDLFRLAYQHGNIGKLGALFFLIQENFYVNKIAALIKTSIATTSNITTTCFPELSTLNDKNDLNTIYPRRTKNMSDVFCDQGELNFYLSVVLKNFKNEELNDAAQELVIFAYEQNQPEIAKKTAITYMRDLKTRMPQDMNLLQQCFQNKAYRSVIALIQDGGCPQYGMHDIDKLLLQDCKKGQFEVFTFILDNPDYQKHIDFTVLDSDNRHYGHYLTIHKQANLVNKLLTAQAYYPVIDSQDDKDESMLDIALLLNEERIVHNLITHMRKTYTNEVLWSILCAIKYPELLIQFFAKYNQELLLEKKYVIPGKTLLELTLEALKHHPDTLLKLILEIKLDVNQANAEGNTPLASFIISRSPQALWWLKNAKPRLNNLDKRNSNLPQLICEFGCLELTQYCHGNTVLENRKDGYNAVELALINNHKHLVSAVWHNIDQTSRSKYIAALKKQPKKNHILQELQNLGLVWSNAKSKKSKTPPVSTSTLTSCSSDGYTTMTDDSVYEDPIHPLDLTSPIVPTAPLGQTAPLANARGSVAIGSDCELFTCTKSEPRASESDAVVSNTVVEKSVADMLLENELCNAAAIKKLKQCANEETLSAIKAHAFYVLEKMLENKQDSMVKHFLRIAQVTSQLSLKNIMDLLQQYAFEQRAMYLIKFFLEQTYFSYHGIFLKDTIAVTYALEHEDYDLLQELIVDFYKKPIIPYQDYLAKPWCYIKNRRLRKIISDIQDLFKAFNNTQTEAITAEIYGSANYLGDALDPNKNPGDLDIFVTPIDIYKQSEKQKLLDLIELFETNGADDTIKKDAEGIPGYRKFHPQARHIVPFKFKGQDIEFNILAHPSNQMRQTFDSSISTIVYRLNDSKMYDLSENNGPYFLGTREINAYTDIAANRIYTLEPSLDSFVADPSRIFRLIRLLAKQTNFCLQDDSEWHEAINKIVSFPRNNIFRGMNFDRLCQQIEFIMEITVASIRDENISILNHLGLLPKITEALRQYKPRERYQKYVRDFLEITATLLPSIAIPQSLSMFGKQDLTVTNILPAPAQYLG